MASSRPHSNNESPSSPNSRILTGDEPLINTTRSGQLVTRFRVVGGRSGEHETRNRNGSRYSHQSSNNAVSGALAADQQYRSTNSLHVPSSKRFQRPQNDVSRHGSVNFGNNPPSATALSAPLPASKQNFNHAGPHQYSSKTNSPALLPSSDRPRNYDQAHSDRSLLLPQSAASHPHNTSISSSSAGGGGASGPLNAPNNYYGTGEPSDDEEGKDGDEEEETDEYNTETEDDQDFGDETFKQVADDINVNVDALLRKLRQADTFDRRETMLKKGNVKNANVVQVEMYEDEDEDEEEEDGEDDSEEDDEEGGGTRSSGARKLWNRITGNSSPSLTTSNNNLPDRHTNNKSPNNHHAVNNNESTRSDTSLQQKSPNEVDDEQAHIAALEKEREAALIATNAASVTANSKENEDILVNDMANQVKARLTADKHSGSTNVSRSTNRNNNKSSGRFASTRDSGEEMSTSSRATFKDDGSTYSLTQGPRSALKRNKKKKKAGGVKVAGGRSGVSFSQNEVSEVCIFEVGDELYVGVQFKRSWVGWVAAFLAVVFETIFDVHVVYLYETCPQSIGAIQAWVGCQRLLVSGILFLVAYFVGIGVQPLKHVMSAYGVLILSLMALALAIGISLEAVVVDVTNATHFFIASVLYCLWIVLYRLFIKEAVFLLEVISIIVTVAGFILSNLSMETNMDTKDAVTGNLLIFVASILYAAYFFLLSRARKWAPIIPMATFQGVCAIIVALPLAAILKAPAGDIFAFFTSGELFGHSIVIAIEGVISNILLILTIDYLDVLSVATIFVLKSAFMPIFAKLIIFDHFDVIQSRKPPSFEITWYVYVGYALAIVGSIITVIFASLRRSFVMRRIASSKRKKAPNPYTKKKRRMEREAAAMGLTLQEHQQHLYQQQQYSAYMQQQQIEQQHYSQNYGGGGGGAGGHSQQFYYQNDGNTSPTHLSPTGSAQLDQHRSRHGGGQKRGGSPSRTKY